MQEPCFREPTLRPVSVTDTTWAYSLASPEGARCLVVMNLRPQPQLLKLPWQGQRPFEPFQSGPAPRLGADGQLLLELSPHEAQLFFER